MHIKINRQNGNLYMTFYSVSWKLSRMKNKEAFFLELMYKDKIWNSVLTLGIKTVLIVGTTISRLFILLLNNM